MHPHPPLAPAGGHYTAMCRVPQAGGDDAWYSFNDEQVSRVSPSQVRASPAGRAAGCCQRPPLVFFILFPLFPGVCGPQAR